LLDRFLAWLKHGRLFVLGHLLIGVLVIQPLFLLFSFIAAVVWLTYVNDLSYIREFINVGAWSGFAATLCGYLFREFSQAEGHFKGSKFTTKKTKQVLAYLFTNRAVLSQWAAPGLATLLIAVLISVF